jgi:hypothetical protein
MGSLRGHIILGGTHFGDSSLASKLSKEQDAYRAMIPASSSSYFLGGHLLQKPLLVLCDRTNAPTYVQFITICIKKTY